MFLAIQAMREPRRTGTPLPAMHHSTGIPDRSGLTGPADQSHIPQQFIGGICPANDQVNNTAVLYCC